MKTQVTLTPPTVTTRVRAGEFLILAAGELDWAVRTALEGEIFISPVISNRMVYDHIHGGDSARSPVDRLSDRELEVLQLIGKGHDMHDIARGLNLSEKTVETHRAHIKDKLNLANAREVTRFATNWLMLQHG